MGARRAQAEAGPQQAHWDDAYQRLTATGVSWYQPYASMSVELATALGLKLQTPVIDVGGGASTLVDSLVGMGYTDVSVLDVSTAALATAKDRLGPDAGVQWIHADILIWAPARTYGLWHDRAVFHFLTDEDDKRAYLEKLGSAISRPGYALLATFAPDGPAQCSGLPVARYDIEELTRRLSSVQVQVVAGRREEHVTPSGVVQPFTWVVARAD
ncbi:class I SAM-dependent methyltransferase [soil metagenome]